MDTTEAIAQNCPPWQWSGRKDKAARFLAAGEKTLEEICAIIYASRRQLFNWRQQPEFSERVEKYRKIYGENAERLAIGHKLNRLRTYNTIDARIKSVIDARAGHPDYEKVPGGRTGLMARNLKVLGSGIGASVIEVFEFDAALVKELREVNKQAAMELNQWPQSGGSSVNVFNQNNNNVHPDTIFLSPDQEIARLECEIATRLAGTAPIESGAAKPVGPPALLQSESGNPAALGGAESTTSTRGDDS